MKHFVVTPAQPFDEVFRRMQRALIDEEPFVTGEWQSQKVEIPVRELLNVSMEMQLPESADELARWTGARLPWAEDHFQERVGGQPLNPAPSEAWWPFAAKKNGTNVAHKSEGEAFSHTYPERMWPKLAGKMEGQFNHMGIRFEYADLHDLVQLLERQPNTRQAYLPLWFPEDGTASLDGKRVPCTLGYHFLIRNNTLQITYYMRSTDLLRHFQDDIYMAGRLAQWVVSRINMYRDSRIHAIGRPSRPAPLKVGMLNFHTVNLHVFEPDVPMMIQRDEQGLAWNA